MRFGLIANLHRVGAQSAISSFIEWIKKRDQQAVLCDDLKRMNQDTFPRLPRNRLAGEVDVLVAMGGDGTLLATVRSVGAAGTPILGINLGSLGFLTQQTPDELVAALDAILNKEYRIEERILLQAAISGRPPLAEACALNDIVLDNGPVSRVLNISLRVNGEDVVTYVADGLIIATPTGSTAYNLAVGGPIVSPRMDAMIASPISPFSLTTRPMIIPGEDRLELSVVSRDRTAMLTLDGQVQFKLSPSETVLISRAGFRCRLVVFPQNSYYKLLKNKLHWGVTPFPNAG